MKRNSFLISSCRMRQENLAFFFDEANLESRRMA